MLILSRKKKVKGGATMADFLAKIKDFIGKIVEFVKGLIKKISGGDEDESAA